MKIALFYPMNLLASWYALGGYAGTLQAMGHDVMDCPFPGNVVQGIPLLQQVMPRPEDLESCDLILSMFHEYTQPWLASLYGWEAWEKIMAATPVVARFDESMNRRDLDLPKRVPELLKWATHHSFPAEQDAKKFNGQWLPFGADTEMFTRTDETGLPAEKVYELGFIGSLYPMRTKYAQHLAKELPNGLFLRCGQVIVQDLSGPLKVSSTRLLVENYRRIKVFFCLPPMSELLVAKVFEVMASGTFLMYPELPGAAAGNMKIFEDGKHLVYYKGGQIKKNVKQILHYLENEEERERIAAAGCYKVTTEYTLKGMLEKLIGLAMPLLDLKDLKEFEQKRIQLVES